MNKYERERQYFQNIIFSAAKGEEYGANQAGIFEIGVAIEALDKQIPEKPKLDNDNGIYETEHCPNCNRKLFPNEHHCKCGQALDWSDTE